MPEPLQLTEAELKLIIKKLTPVKQAGHGEVLIQVQDGRIVYIKQTFGEQVKMELKP
jgi:hypothetical protein